MRFPLLSRLLLLLAIVAFGHAAPSLWFETLRYPSVTGTSLSAPSLPVTARWCTLLTANNGILCMSIRPCSSNASTFYNLTVDSFVCDAPNITQLLSLASSTTTTTVQDVTTLPGDFTWFRYDSNTTIVLSDFQAGTVAVGSLLRERTQCVSTNGLPLSLHDYQSTTNVNGQFQYFCCETQTRLLNSSQQYNMACTYLSRISPSPSWGVDTNCLTEDVTRSWCTATTLLATGIYSTSPYTCSFACRSPCTTYRDRYVGLSTVCTNPDTLAGCIPETHSSQCGVNILKYSAFLCNDAQEQIQTYLDQAQTQVCDATAGGFGCNYFSCACLTGCARHATCNGAGWLYQMPQLPDASICVCEPGYTGKLCEFYTEPLYCNLGQET